MDDGRSGLRLDRLRLGEWIIGAAALALAIDVLALPWYSLTAIFRQGSSIFGAATSATGLQAHHVLGPLALVCCLLGIATWLAQAGQRAPALGLCLTVITAVASLLLSVGLLIRVVFVPPAVLVQGEAGAHTQQTGVWAVLGLFLAVALFAGTWISMRTDGIAAADAPAQIEQLALAQRTA